MAECQRNNNLHLLHHTHQLLWEPRGTFTKTDCTLRFRRREGYLNTMKRHFFASSINTYITATLPSEKQRTFSGLVWKSVTDLLCIHFLHVTFPESSTEPRSHFVSDPLWGCYPPAHFKRLSDQNAHYPESLLHVRLLGENIIKGHFYIIRTSVDDADLLYWYIQVFFSFL